MSCARSGREWAVVGLGAAGGSSGLALEQVGGFDEPARVPVRVVGDPFLWWGGLYCSPLRWELIVPLPVPVGSGDSDIKGSLSCAVGAGPSESQEAFVKEKFMTLPVNIHFYGAAHPYCPR